MKGLVPDGSEKDVLIHYRGIFISLVYFRFLNMCSCVHLWNIAGAKKIVETKEAYEKDKSGKGRLDRDKKMREK